MGSSTPHQTELDIASKNLIERVNGMLQKGKSNCKLTNLSIQELVSQCGKHKYWILVRVQKDSNGIISYAVKGQYFCFGKKTSVKEIQLVANAIKIRTELKIWLASLEIYQFKCC